MAQPEIVRESGSVSSKANAGENLPQRSVSKLAQNSAPAGPPSLSAVFPTLLNGADQKERKEEPMKMAEDVTVYDLASLNGSGHLKTQPLIPTNPKVPLITSENLSSGSKNFPGMKGPGMALGQRSQFLRQQANFFARAIASQPQLENSEDVSVFNRVTGKLRSRETFFLIPFKIF